jgi:predicted  nucleic acid-binding Zn-ribbon protein
MAASNLYEPIFRYSQGSGFRLYAFQFGATTTPVSTYADPAGITPNPWPVILADAGNGGSEDHPGDGIAPIFVTSNVTIDIRDGDDVSQPGYPSHFVRGVTEAELQAVDDRVSGRLDGHDDALYLLQSRATDLEGRATDLEGRATAVEGRLDTAEEDIDALKDRAGALEDRAGALEDRAGALEDRAGALEDRATATEARLTADEEDIGTLQDRATALEGRANALEAWRSVDEPAINTLQSQMGTANDNIGNLQGRMNTAESDIDTLQSDVDALQLAVSGVTAAVGASNYSWDKESDTLHCWGRSVTASNGIARVSFPLPYDSEVSVIPVGIWAGEAFVVVKLTEVTLSDFIVFGGVLNHTRANDVDGQAINFHWQAIGKKAG